jgi:hypothetical protein
MRKGEGEGREGDGMEGEGVIKEKEEWKVTYRENKFLKGWFYKFFILV